MKGAEVSIDDREGVQVARISGEVDIANVSQVYGELLAAVPNTTIGVVLDLSATTYMDSRGLEMLLQLWERLRLHQQELRLVVAPASPLRRLLTLIHLDEKVALDEATDEAVRLIHRADDRGVGGTAHQ